MPMVGLISTLPSMRGYVESVSIASEVEKLNVSPLNTLPRNRLSLTRVADMPGYPTRKALFGGPHTRTNAVMTVQSLA